MNLLKLDEHEPAATAAEPILLPPKGGSPRLKFYGRQKTLIFLM